MNPKPPDLTQLDSPFVRVLVFNTSVLSVTVSVNQGPQFVIPGVTPNYIPQQPPGGGPGWSYQQPSPGTLAPGNNFLTISIVGSTQPQNLSINLSGQIRWDSLLLYLVFGENDQPGWFVLNTFRFAGGNLPAVKGG